MWSSTGALGAAGAGAGVGLGGLTASGSLGSVGNVLSAPRRALWSALGGPESGADLLDQWGLVNKSSGASPLLGALAEMAGDPLTYLPGIGGALGGLAKDWGYAGKLAQIAGPVAQDAGEAARVAAEVEKAHDAELLGRAVDYGTAHPTLTTTSPGPALTRIGDRFTGELDAGEGLSDWQRQLAPLAAGPEAPDIRDLGRAAADPRAGALAYAPEVEAALPDLLNSRGNVSAAWMKALNPRPIGAVKGFGADAGRDVGDYLAQLGLGGADQEGKAFLAGPGRLSDVPGLEVRGNRAGQAMAGGLLDNPLQYRETQPLAMPHASEAVPGLPPGYEGLPLDQAAEMAGAERGRTAGQLDQLRGTVGNLPPLLRALLRLRGIPPQLR